MSARLTVVVGVTGGIAAYKAVGVVRGFVLAGHDVHVIATEAALRFVGRPTLEAISRNPVNTDLFEGVAQVRHVSIGQGADLIVIAPATANTIAKLATGLADDLLTNTVLASTAPIVLAPAMHTQMWQNAATVANVATVHERGFTIVGPASGALTGSDSGIGRMEEPETIVERALAVVTPGTLSGRHVVITAGGTREPLDPVRFIGNRSSGRQGVAIAQAALDRGARVTLIAAHIEVAPPAGATLVEVASALELQRAVTDAAASADIVVMAAAVADYRPASVQDAKIKKTASHAPLTLELVENPDILAELSAATFSSDSRHGRIIVGFAAETESDADALLEIGRQKLARKGCDYLVINRVGWSTGFVSESNEVVVLNSAGDIVMEAVGDKLSVAARILDTIASA